MKTHTPTMSDIARRAKVSKNTVSLALRNDPEIPPVTRHRIRQIADRLGYQKNPIVAHLMAQLRTSRSPKSQSTLALLNANLDREAFIRHPTIPVYVEGCHRRAHELGYSLDEFWLHDPQLNGTRLNRILRSRNIRGLVIVGVMNERHLPLRFVETWETFPAVVTGVRTQDPALSFACVDHHMLTLKAVEIALDRGYKRPAMVLDRRIDELVDGRYTAGYLMGLRQCPRSPRPRTFYFSPETGGTAEAFVQWVCDEKPDVVLTLYNVVRRWIEKAGLKVPSDLALIQMERRQNQTDWAGMVQHSDVIGAAAIEMVIGLIHNDQTGIPAFPQATLIGSTWVNGDTCPSLLRDKCNLALRI